MWSEKYINMNWCQQLQTVFFIYTVVQGDTVEQKQQDTEASAPKSVVNTLITEFSELCM